MSNNTVRIATRTSPLALWQAEYVAKCLQQANPKLEIEYLKLVTKGDKWLATPLSKIGGKGLFVKELETAILKGKADIAVHSIKDMPMELPKGMTLAAICQREDPADVLLSQQFSSIDELPKDAIVGTSSLRRQCQLKAMRPDLQINNLRGNVGTRLRKIEQGRYHAIILAYAGLVRLGETALIKQKLDPLTWLPAAGQGAIGIECRQEDSRVITLINSLDHADTRHCITAERAISRCLGGSCQVPIGAYATLTNGELRVQGLVGKVDGSLILHELASGPVNQANQLGEQIAQQLLAKGADKILADIDGQEHPPGQSNI